MRHPEHSPRFINAFLTIALLGSLYLAACSPVEAQSNLDIPHTNTQILTCIYDSTMPPAPDKPICLPSSTRLAGVPITLKDNSGNSLVLLTNQNGQLDISGATFFSSTDYPSWSFDYSKPVAGYCLAYPPVLIQDASMPEWSEVQLAYNSCK